MAKLGRPRTRKREITAGLRKKLESRIKDPEFVDSFLTNYPFASLNTLAHMYGLTVYGVEAVFELLGIAIPAEPLFPVIIKTIGPIPSDAKIHPWEGGVTVTIPLGNGLRQVIHFNPINAPQPHHSDEDTDDEPENKGTNETDLLSFVWNTLPSS